MKILPALAVLILCGIIVLVLYCTITGTSVSDMVDKITGLRKKTSGGKNDDGGKKTKPKPWNPPVTPTVTYIPKVLTIEQLSEDGRQVIETFDIKENMVRMLDLECISISRPGAQGDIVLSAGEQCAYTVSEAHILIARDKDAGVLYFWERDGGTTNDTFLADGTKVTKGDITDGMLLYLGHQPIRFRIPKRKTISKHAESHYDDARPAPDYVAGSFGTQVHRRHSR